MSAVVCGKRSLFDELHGSPPVPKRLRCGGGGSSPVRFTSWRSSSSPPYYTEATDLSDQILHLRVLFPDLDEQLIEKVLEASANSLDLAVKSLNELRLSSGGRNVLDRIECASTVVSEGGNPTQGCESQAEQDSVAVSLPKGREWVDLFVQEMLNASSLEDARDRATKALEAFEKIIVAQSGSTYEDLQRENSVLKEQLQGLLRDNHVLKRAVAIQYERQAEHENCSREIEQLKQLVTQYQEQVRTLELNSYALGLHLRKAQEGTSMPGRFHPDVF